MLSCILKITKMQLCLREREEKKVICTYFVGQMTRFTTLASKLRQTAWAYCKEIRLMVYVSIPLGFGSWFPVRTEILFTCESY